MKILVLSDSHGAVDTMARCVEAVQPRHILHLGDCLRDAEALRDRYPNIPMTTVPGNCDWASFDRGEVVLELSGRRILMMHGHTRRVKESPLAALYAAREAGAEILLYGHTHRPCVDYDGTLYTMNPGAAREGRYGVITVENGRVDCSVYKL